MPRAKYLLSAAVALCLMETAIPEAKSCSVPVFRYALERWKPDPYKGIYIYQGELTDTDRAVLRQLEEAALDSEAPFNLRIRAVETKAFSEDKLEKLLKGPMPKKLPALAVWYPGGMGKTVPLWILEPTPSIVRSLTHSPKRRQLAESLIKGESVVWVFVPSGHPEKDARAKALIRRELDLALKSLEKMPYYILVGSRKQKLRYGFSILELSRNEPEERFFLEMLVNSEPDLAKHTDEPMVFPVFGRGRLLGCLFGELISEDNLQSAIALLAASCSCEVKALNPGIDLLVAADWDRVVMGELYADNDAPMPELSSIVPEPPEVSRPDIEYTGKTSSRQSHVLMNYGITVGLLLVTVLFTGLVLNHRRKRE